MTTEERLIEMETKFSHQEWLLEQLNGVLVDQQKKIDQLEALVLGLVKRVESKASEPEFGPAGEKPPHY